MLYHGELKKFKEKVMESHGFLKAQKSTNPVSMLLFHYIFFSCQVTVPKDLVALMSAVQTGSKVHPQKSDRKIYTFTQKVHVIFSANN